MDRIHRSASAGVSGRVFVAVNRRVLRPPARSMAPASVAYSGGYSPRSLPTGNQLLLGVLALICRPKSSARLRVSASSEIGPVSSEFWPSKRLRAQRAPSLGVPAGVSRGIIALRSSTSTLRPTFVTHMDRGLGIVGNDSGRDVCADAPTDCEVVCMSQRCDALKVLSGEAISCIKYRRRGANRRNDLYSKRSIRPTAAPVRTPVRS